MILIRKTTVVFFPKGVYCGTKIGLFYSFIPEMCQIGIVNKKKLQLIYDLFDEIN